MECFINGKRADITDYKSADMLTQAVLISLFTWRKSNDDDGVPAPHRNGWWGDTFADVSNDRIGSRLWLLRREKLTDEVASNAKAYAEEALKWMIDDALASDVIVQTYRNGDRLDMTVEIIKPNDGQRINARFQDIWS